MSAAIEMPESLAALLPKVRRKPLPLSRKGKTAALLVSVHTNIKNCGKPLPKWKKTKTAIGRNKPTKHGRNI